MKGLALAWVGFTFFLTLPGYAQVVTLRKIPVDKQTEEILASKFRAYQTVDTDEQPSAGRQGLASTLRLMIDDSPSGIVIPLEPNDIRDASYRAVATTPAGEVIQDHTVVKWFKGYVNGDPTAPARFSREADGLAGFFFHESRMHFIEPLQRHYPAPPGVLIVYEATAVISPQVKCDANELEQYRAATQARQASAALPPLSNGLSLRIATQADYTYYRANGAETNDHILGVINQIDGLYEKDFGVNFKVVYQHVYETDNDPFTSNDALTLLQQFRDDWNAKHQNVDRNIAFLFNAVDLPTGTLGRAYQAQACEHEKSSYGFFSYRDLGYEAAIVAHEIGHMLNADHETPAACQADPSLMCASIGRGIPFKFSTTAQAAISTYLNSRPCFNTTLETRIHPVPARTDLIIECSTSTFSATLYDPLGKKAGVWTFSAATGSISTMGLPPGLYILHITTGDQTHTQRIEILNP